jgi:hypothetical protein
MRAVAGGGMWGNDGAICANCRQFYAYFNSASQFSDNKAVRIFVNQSMTTRLTRPTMWSVFW